MVKIHFLPKVIKNGLVSEKNYFIFFHNNEDESDNEIHLKKRIISEAPPPYTS